MAKETLTDAGAARALLALPATERTRLVVVSNEDYEAITGIPPYAKAAGLVLGGAYAGGVAASAAWFATPAGWATAAGAALSYPAYRRWVRPYVPLLRAQRALGAIVVPTSVAGRIRMANGGVEARTVYVVHPRKSREYLPAGPFHLLLAQEKVAEAMGLMRALGAYSIKVRAEFAEDSSRTAKAVLSQASEVVNAAGGQRRTETGAVESTYTCDGSDEPYVPDRLVWLDAEPTWKELVGGRLSKTNRIRSFTVLVHLDQTYGFDGELAAKARKHDLKLGGDFSDSLQRVWRMTAEFPSGGSRDA